MILKYIEVERLIHSLKTTIACIIGFLLTQIIGFSASQWVIITIIVVMCAQIYVGSVLQKGYLRFLGTLIGCVFAVFTLLVFGATDYSIPITIGLSSFIFSYIATGNERLSYVATLGPVTTAIVLLGQAPTVYYAAERFFEIALGILIATLVSQFILPIHARTHLRRTQVKTLMALRDYYHNVMVIRKNHREDGEANEVDEQIVKLLSRQRQLTKDTKGELFATAFNPRVGMQLLQYEKEILRAIDFIHQAYMQGDMQSFFSQSLVFKQFNTSVMAIFNALIDQMSIAPWETVKLPAMPSVTQLRHELGELNLPSDVLQSVNLNGLLFSAEMLTLSLSRLARLHYTLESKMN